MTANQRDSLRQARYERGEKAMKQQRVSGVPPQARWQEQQRRRRVIEEFFTAYRLAQHANNGCRGRTPAPAMHWHPLPPAPACIVALGLPWPCTRQDIKHAFRTKAKTVHPDSGGSSEAFQRLYRAYQEALALVN